MAAPHVIIAGPIGAGKSTLTKLLSEQLGLTPFFESSGHGEDANPFLAEFYAPGGRARWSFASQVFFLTQAIEHQHQIAGLPAGAIQDRSTFEHLGIFARPLHDAGDLNEHEYGQLLRLAAAATASLARPDLLVYLRATPELIRDRILSRGRPEEIQAIHDDWQYFVDHCAQYDPWVEQFDICPVLRIEAAQVNPGEPEHVARLVRERLR